MARLSESRRQLESDSGRLYRLARKVERRGGNPNSLLQAAAQAEYTQGGGIRSAEENAETRKVEDRIQRGLLESQRRSLNEPGGPSSSAPSEQNTDSFLSDISRSRAIASGDAGARQRAVSRGAALGMSESDVDSAILRARGESQPPQTLQASPESTSTAAPSNGVSIRQSLPRQFGSDFAQKNLAEGNLNSAVDDYFRRANEADNPSPGNMQELAQANLAGPPAPRGLQQSLIDQRGRRPQSVTESEQVNPITPRNAFTVGGNPVRDPDYGITRSPQERQQYADRESARLGLQRPSTGSVILGQARPTEAPRRGYVADTWSQDTSIAPTGTPTVTRNPAILSPAQRVAQNRERLKALGDRNVENLPSWTRGTAIGSLLESLSRPRL